MKRNLHIIPYRRWKWDINVDRIQFPVMRYYRKRGDYWFCPTHQKYQAFSECRFRWQCQRAGWWSRLQAWNRKQ